MTPFTGAVLTGGRSTRYGADKATLFAPAVIAALRAAGADPVIRVGGEQADIPDAAGAGPMAGIRAALSHARTDIVMILACDLPDAAVPVVDDRREPLHTAWRATALGKIDERARAVHEVLANLEVTEVSNLDPSAFRNVNTPDD
jgi:molybdopterin-guanine dinucleotide biosynthesis protein A